MLPNRSGLVFVLALAVFCLGGQAAQAQVNSVPYWIAGWPLGFGGGLTVDESSNAYGTIPALVGSDFRGGSFASRYNFSNGWFVGSERGGSGLGLNGFSQDGGWSATRPLSYEGVQFGYNFKSAPVTVYAGFDSLKYNTGIGSPFTGLDSSNNLSGYSAHAGVEFRPTSNLSLSLGVGYTQQPAGIESGINSLSLPGASPFAVGGRR